MDLQTVRCQRCHGIFGWSYARQGDLMTVESIIGPASSIRPENHTKAYCYICNDHTNLYLDTTD